MCGAWVVFDNGSSIGQVGSEKGIIIKDEENLCGARITIEKGGTAPYSITLGIYGWMFHTDFYSEPEKADMAYAKFKKKIEEILELLMTDEQKRMDNWEDHLHEQMQGLVNRSAE